MNELVYLKNDEAVCDSLQVAEKFEKRHADVIRKIQSILNDEPTQNCVRCFKQSNYKDAKGETRPMYLMNKDGFTFLVMGFTGKKANEWKWKYINAFNSMESFIREKSTEAWIETRKAGQITRQAETDVIKKLVEYAKTQGSEHSQMLYVTYSKLANNSAGISDRNTATISELNKLTFIENIILNQIHIGMQKNMHYKAIYQACKKQIELFKEIAYLENGLLQIEASGQTAAE